MAPQILLRWLSKNFAPQGVVIFRGEGLHIVGQSPEKLLQRSRADFLRRHQ
jgi:hypothetical protein